jgi:hypothetical protein
MGAVVALCPYCGEDLFDFDMSMGACWKCHYQLPQVKGIPRTKAESDAQNAQRARLCHTSSTRQEVR